MRKFKNIFILLNIILFPSFRLPLRNLFSKFINSTLNVIKKYIGLKNSICITTFYLLHLGELNSADQILTITKKLCFILAVKYRVQKVFNSLIPFFNNNRLIESVLNSVNSRRGKIRHKRLNENSPKSVKF